MVDRIKREARERMARAGETYTEARRAVSHTTTGAPPAQAKLRAAAAVLLRAWAPGPQPALADEDYDETNGCGCGGTYGDDEPVCNCGPGCVCHECRHRERATTRRCHLPTPRPDQPYAWCGAPTRYRIVAYCLHRDGVTRTADDGDPAAEHGMVRLGDSIQRHPATYACSTQHARDLIELDRQRRSTADPASPLSATSTYYEVEPFRYEPDDTDVPGPLHPLHRDLEAALYWAGRTIAATYDAGHGPADYSAEGMLRSVARAALGAVEYIEHRDQAAADD